ncbi:uncharacterized protein LOC124595152 [Schistocerca americana]|uniref:uncharacterized protein LOC124595152 n=1 Tax=Schistocerca americana TaxID=7009 RepID=UPI001F4F7792|nr:uncharacterized protein LOC124595152 [Schistocerca americana]
MESEELFIITFVAGAEKCPELYDYMRGDYSRKDITERPWKKISKEVVMTEAVYVLVVQNPTLWQMISILTAQASLSPVVLAFSAERTLANSIRRRVTSRVFDSCIFRGAEVTGMDLLVR